uniref:MSCRAMM family protein n=1 Tax=Pseudonocardia nigra TaxID=1921578 RepID=UPI001C5D1EED
GAAAPAVTAAPPAPVAQPVAPAEPEPEAETQTETATQAEELVAETEPEPPTPPTGLPEVEPEPAPAPTSDMTGGDTPWRRAARMADGGDVLAEVPEPVGFAPLRLVSSPEVPHAEAERNADVPAAPGRLGAHPVVEIHEAERVAPQADEQVPAPVEAASGREADQGSAAPNPVAAESVPAHLPEGQGYAVAETREDDAMASQIAEQVPGVREPDSAGPEPMHAHSDPAEQVVVEAVPGPPPAEPHPVVEPPASEPLVPQADEQAVVDPLPAPVAENTVEERPAPETASDDVPVAAAADVDEPAGEPVVVTRPEAAARVSRPRRSPDERAAEQAAADLALLRTFGVAGSRMREDATSVVALAAVARGTVEPASDGAAQPVRFRAVRRNGVPVAHASVTLLDDRGREAGEGTADGEGCGEVLAPGSGSYVLVSTAAGHQPGAVAITVAGGPADAEVLLVRSASVSGAVYGEDGPVIGARVTLVQDGEVIGTADTGADGKYRIEDLGSGEYDLAVAAPECEPVASALEIPDEADLHHDVDLVPAGLPAMDRRADDDLLSGQR